MVAAVAAEVAAAAAEMASAEAALVEEADVAAVVMVAARGGLCVRRIPHG